MMYYRKEYISAYKIQDTRYFILQIRAPGGHDTTFIISTYTINKVEYNNYFITFNHVCHRLEHKVYFMKIESRQSYMLSLQYKLCNDQCSSICA